MHPESGVWMIHAAPGSRNSSGESVLVVMTMLDDDEIFNNGFRCLTKPECCISILVTVLFDGTVAKFRVRETDLGASNVGYAF